MVAKDILGKNLMFLVAHPDDESFLASGTIHQNYLAGGSSSLVCATYGEKGKSHMPDVTQKQLKKIRKKELENVSDFLKVKILYTLGLPDGKLAQHKKLLQQKIEAVLKQESPAFLLSFGQDGISGHKDHIYIGEVGRRLAKSHSIPFVAFSPQPSMANKMKIFKRRRKYGVYAKKVVHAPHNLKIKSDPRVKLKALRMHKSQSPFDHLSKKTILQLASYDYFRS